MQNLPVFRMYPWGYILKNSKFCMLLWLGLYTTLRIIAGCGKGSQGGDGDGGVVVTVVVVVVVVVVMEMGIVYHNIRQWYPKPWLEATCKLSSDEDRFKIKTPSKQHKQHSPCGDQAAFNCSDKRVISLPVRQTYNPLIRTVKWDFLWNS